MALILSLLTTINIVAAATCNTQNTLIDDFATTENATILGENKIINKLYGDYGSAGAPFTIETANKRMKIVAATDNIGQPEPEANPGTAPTFNYWFAKFNEDACYDLTPYRAIQFDLIAPAGSNMNFTLTQKTPDCIPSVKGEPVPTQQGTRLVDSVYRPLTAFVTPNGQKQTVTLYFANFSKNLVGGTFDFKHLKDWTIVNLEPAGATFYMSDLKFLGGPIDCTESTSTTKTNSPPQSTTPPPKNASFIQTVSWMTLALLVVYWIS